MRSSVYCVALAFSSACYQGSATSTFTARLATEIVSAPGQTGVGFGDANRATNGVRGAGERSGSFDVYSLDYATRPELIVRLPCPVANGPGRDLVIFENPFEVRTTADQPRYVFMDPIVVSVSVDGVSFLELPHQYLAPTPTTYSALPEHWRGFAGLHPVFLNVDTTPLEPLDEAAGGDGFDVDTFTSSELQQAFTRGVRFVKLTPAAIEVDPQTGNVYPRDPVGNGPDIDGIVVRCQ